MTAKILRFPARKRPPSTKATLGSAVLLIAAIGGLALAHWLVKAVESIDIPS